MLTDYLLPQLGENVTEATIVKILISEGDTISIDQIILEVETGKANLEVQSEYSGRVKQLLVQEGSKCLVGQKVMTIEQIENELNNEPNISDETQTIQVENISTDKSSAEIIKNVPNLGENITEATIVKVLTKVGNNVQIGDVIFEIETGKASLEITAEENGQICNIFGQENSKVKPGDMLYSIKTFVDTEAKPIDIPDISITSNSEEKLAELHIEEVKPILESNNDSFQPDTYNLKKVIYIPASPSVRKFAREIGIDINKVSTENNKRITIDDVKAYAKKLAQSFSNEIIDTKPQQTYTQGPLYYEPLPDFSKWGNTDIQEMSLIRKKTAEHLSYAWNTIPHVTQFDKADITNFETFKTKYAKKFEKDNVKITITAVILKVLTYALKKYPQFNSSIDMETGKIIYKNYYNLGVAVDTDRGLLVPVIKNVDEKSIIQISKELTDIAKKTRDKKISLEEMQGGTFTVSNLGGFGGTYFTPIVNYPEVAILGLSRSNSEPVFIDGKFEPRIMLPLSLSYDHRIIDGADAIRFLRWVIDALQEPLLLSLEI